MFLVQEHLKPFSIENVFFVHYDYKLKGAKSKLGENRIQIVAQKVRYGTTGEALLEFEGDKVSMRDIRVDNGY